MNLAPVQAALRALLVAAGVAGGRVTEGDAVTAPSLPYVDIGSVDVVDESGVDLVYCAATWTLHVWSAERGMKTVHEIMDDIAAALGGPPPVVTGLVVVGMTVASSQVVRDPDGVTRHGIVSVRTLLSSP